MGDLSGFEIDKSPLKSLNRVAQLTKTSIAANAEDATDDSGPMVVVYAEILG